MLEAVMQPLREMPLLEAAAGFHFENLEEFDCENALVSLEAASKHLENRESKLCSKYGSECYKSLHACADSDTAARNWQDTETSFGSSDPQFVPAPDFCFCGC